VEVVDIEVENLVMQGGEVIKEVENVVPQGGEAVDIEVT
jgi:hypothetical protein